MYFEVINMLEKIDHITIALNAGAYQAALALALTLPDICAKVEYKKSTTTNVDYIAWVNKFVDFNPLSSWNATKQAEMNGTLIYALRCAFLHCGNDEIKNQVVAQNLPHTTFKVVPPNSLGEGNVYKYYIKDGSNNTAATEAHIDAQAICKLLCIATENYYNAYTPKSDFDDYLL